MKTGQKLIYTYTIFEQKASCIRASISEFSLYIVTGQEHAIFENESVSQYKTWTSKSVSC